MTPSVTVLYGDARELASSLEPSSIDCVVTSPPYWGLRDYGHPGQFGLEATPGEYVAKLVDLFGRMRPALKDEGTVWLNLGDCYWSDSGAGHQGNGASAQRAHRRHTQLQIKRGDGSGLKSKDLCMIPARVGLALQENGWWLRSQVIWAKPNGMPTSQQDRCTSSHETIWMLSKSELYWSDFDAIKTRPREASLVRLAQETQLQAGSHRANGGGKTNGTMKAMPGKQSEGSRVYAAFNERWDATERVDPSAPVMMRDVWFVSPEGYDGAHFAVMPAAIAKRCILAGCPRGGTVLDPFMGSGTVAEAAALLGRNAVGFEINEEYGRLIDERLAQMVLL